MKSVWGNYGWILPKPELGNRYPDTGSTKDPKKMNPSRHSIRHTVIKMVTVKETIIKAAREKQNIIYKGTHLLFQ